MGKITDRQIREYLGHGRGNRRVQIRRNGQVHYYGSTDDTDRTQDWWHYADTRDQVAREVEREREISETVARQS